MTFNWAITTHLDEADGQSWLKGPKNRTSPQIFMSPNTLKVMVIRHPFERLASGYNYMLNGSPVTSEFLKGGKTLKGHSRTFKPFLLSLLFLDTFRDS